MKNIFVSYKDKLPVLSYDLAEAVANSDERTRIHMFIGKKLVFDMWHNVVVDMMANNSIDTFIDKRKKQLGIK